MVGRLMLATMLVAASAELRSQSTQSTRLEKGEVVTMRLAFEPIVLPAAMRQRWTSDPHWSFGPFDEARFGFRAVTLTLEQQPTACFDERFKLARLIVAVERKSGSAPHSSGRTDRSTCGPARFGRNEM